MARTPVPPPRLMSVEEAAVTFGIPINELRKKGWADLPDGYLYRVEADPSDYQDEIDDITKLSLVFQANAGRISDTIYWRRR